MTEQEDTNVQASEQKIDGRTKRALDAAIAKKQVSQASYYAVMEGRITLGEAKEIGREGSPYGPAPRANKTDRSRECLCLCGNRTKGGRFVPGHDVRLYTYAKECVRGERELTPEQLQYVEQSGKLVRARQRVAEEGAKAKAKATKKAKVNKGKK